MKSTEHPRKRRGFSLVEVLVVISIIALLIAILLPALQQVQVASKDAVCLSRMGQIGKATLAYAVDHDGAFPSNTPKGGSPPYWTGGKWYEGHIMGDYLPEGAYDNLSGGVLACPHDEGAVRTYALNLWASATEFSRGSAAIEASGTRFDSGVVRASQMILVGETWSKWNEKDKMGNKTGNYIAAQGFGGSADTPGARFRFTSSAPNNPWYTRYAAYRLATDIQWTLHSTNDDPEVAAGVTRFTYVDGSVLSKKLEDLVDGSGVSTLDSEWSPSDPNLLASP